MQLVETFRMVRDVSQERGYNDWETRQHRRDAAVFSVMWLCTVVAAAFVDQLPLGAREPVRVWRSTWAIPAFSAVMLCLAYGVVRLCRSLIVMIDAFSCDAVDSVHLQHISHVWNTTQAVLRKVSADVEKCLVVLCLVLAVLVPLIAVDLAILGIRSQDVPAIFPGRADIE